MKIIDSFKYAFIGLQHSLQERNVRFHLLATIAVIILGIFFSITNLEWVLLLLCIGLVLAVELLNTALEEICDVITSLNKDAYPKMGKPKDIGAGAVLVSAIIAAILGSIIFVPYIVSFFSTLNS